MQFIPFGNLYGRIKELLDAGSKLLAAVASVDQKVDNRCQGNLVLFSHSDCSSPIGDIGSSDHNGMWQAECINVNMAFNTRDFLASIVAFLFGCVGILDTLGISNAETGLSLLATGGAGLAN